MEWLTKQIYIILSIEFSFEIILTITSLVLRRSRCGSLASNLINPKISLLWYYMVIRGSEWKNGNLCNERMVISHEWAKRTRCDITTSRVRGDRGKLDQFSDFQGFLPQTETLTANFVIVIKFNPWLIICAVFEILNVSSCLSIDR